MEENIKNCFQKAKLESNQELKDKIWQKITLRNKRIVSFKIASFSFLGLISISALVPMFQILVNDFTQSGFYEYLSLAFSSGGMFSTYWKEFAYSIAESLPIMSIVFSLALLFVFFLSLRYVLKQIINNNSISKAYRIA